MLKIYKELLIKDDNSDCSIEILLLNLIESKNSAKNRRPIWIENVLELLNDNWSEPITLKDMADAANVHPITISKHFPKYFACTLGEYRRRFKIDKSLDLIKTSRFSLTEIAQRCGFSDQSHFTRTFKQVTGFLPRDYRSL
jgi:AraC family transcriptional regulator